MPNCSNCGAPMRMDRHRDVLVCSHCHSEQEPPFALEHLEWLDQTTLPCPVCTSPLSNGRLEGHLLVCCARCLGMLIDMNRFVMIIEAVRARVAPAPRTPPPRRQNPGERVLNCPRCARPMIGHLYGGPGNIVIDTCERCLVNWLDAGELRRIAVAPDSR